MLRSVPALCENDSRRMQMIHSEIHDYAAIAVQVVGKMDVIAHNATPNPWFCKDIFRKRDLQWAGYIGKISNQEQALVFGINLEFTPAWRRIFPKIKGNIEYFSGLLGKYKNLEWHWMARPGVIAKDPEIRFLSPNMWTFQVDLTKWLSELEDILEKKKMLSASVPIRPQIQIMRYIGLPIQLSDVPLIKQNVQQTALDLQRFVDFLGK